MVVPFPPIALPLPYPPPPPTFILDFFYILQIQLIVSNETLPEISLFL